ncbi:MAG: hypothetical protein K6E88_11425, partial [Lachnospiraceae bacterium]|nr:hypothetical protein [Lachnospiraceae bacterium]
YIAAAYTTFASYALLMLFHYFAVNHVLKERVYSNSFMFISMFVCAVVGISMSFFYNDGIRMAVMRYAVALIVLSIFAFVKRDDLKLLTGYIRKRIRPGT